jgi:hypothetical protein
MNSNLKYLIWICFIFFVSCKKENGLFYLRVIPPADTSITALEVFDALGKVPADGEYYPVTEWLEIKYILKDVLQNKIKDWDPTMYYDECDYYDELKHEFFGEFEKDEKDKYYTLRISYYAERSDEAIYNSWGKYYFWYYNYYDQSCLTFSYNKE